MTTRAIDVRIARGTISSDSRSRYKEQYKNIRSIELDYGDYPFSAPGSTAAVEDLRYWQHELGLQGLFATETVCSVFELRDGSGDIFSGIGDRDLQQMIRTSEGVKLRAIFCNVNEVALCEDLRFRSPRLSLSRSSALDILNYLQVSPSFLSGLLSTQEYTPAGCFLRHNQNNQAQALEFFCDHYRSYKCEHTSRCAVYMTHDFSTSCTNYIIVNHSQDALSATVQQRLCDLFCRGPRYLHLSDQAYDPFFLHCMIMHEILAEAEVRIAELRDNLCRELVAVNNLVPEGHWQSPLEDATVAFQKAGQFVIHAISATESMEVHLESMTSAHQRYAKVATRHRTEDVLVRLEDALELMRLKTQHLKRKVTMVGLQKDAAINLACNLVSQKNAVINERLARAAKKESSTMKRFTWLSFLFLPAMLVASIFAMNGVQHYSWGTYITITLSLTVCSLLFFELCFIAELVRWYKAGVSLFWHSEKMRKVIYWLFGWLSVWVFGPEVTIWLFDLDRPMASSSKESINSTASCYTCRIRPADEESFVSVVARASCSTCEIQAPMAAVIEAQCRASNVESCANGGREGAAVTGIDSRAITLTASGQPSRE